MNDVCFILLILVLIIIVSRNSDIEKFENIETEMNKEVPSEVSEELPKVKKAPRKLKPASDNVPSKVDQVPNVHQDHGEHLDFKVSGFEDGDMFASYEDNYGDVVPLSMQADYAILKDTPIIRPNLMGNIEEERTPGYISDSQAPSFDPTANTGLMAVGQVGGKKEGKVGGSKSVEVHFVYAEWCGHSQNAVPAFEELVKVNDVKTQSGAPVTFVMTEEQSDNFSDFKGKVQGFPTYMTVVKENGEVKSMDELIVQSRTKEGIMDASRELV